MLCCAMLCAAMPCSVTKLPPGTVVVRDDTIYVPKKENNVIKMLAKAIPGMQAALASDLTTVSPSLVSNS
jgi:hypothetical protein